VHRPKGGDIVWCLTRSTDRLLLQEMQPIQAGEAALGASLAGTRPWQCVGYQELCSVASGDTSANDMRRIINQIESLGSIVDIGTKTDSTWGGTGCMGGCNPSRKDWLDNQSVRAQGAYFRSPGKARPTTLVKMVGFRHSSVVVNASIVMIVQSTACLILVATSRGTVLYLHTYLQHAGSCADSGT
jgi:hypothetical protein